MRGSLYLILSSALVAFDPASSGPRAQDVSNLNERFTAIEKAQNEALERYREELKAAKDDQPRQAAVDRYVSEARKNEAAALELVRTNPGDPIVVAALGFVIRTARVGPGNGSEQALDILARDHVHDPKLGALCQEIFYFFHLPVAESLIRSVLQQSPSREDRGLACHALATYLGYQARMVRRLRENPEMVKDYEQICGQEAMSRLLREKDPDALDREAEALLERTISDFGTVPSTNDQRPLSEIAAGELFALRHLSIGKVAPEIEGRDDEGKEFKLSDSRGKVVVLTFSGNWCGPCRAMYTQERELVVRMRGKPFALLSVNTDEDIEALRRSIEIGEITWRCWWDSGTTGPITTRWGVSSFPSIFVIDSKGVIRYKDVRDEDLHTAVASLLYEVSTAQPLP